MKRRDAGRDVSQITRRTVVRLAGAVGGDGMLAACSVGGQGGTAPAKALSPATIEVAYNFTALEQPCLEKHTQAFSQQFPQITVKQTNTQGDTHYEKLTTMVAGGTPPHMSHMTSRSAGQFIRGQKIYSDLSPFAKTDKVDLKDFWPLLSEGFSDEEKRPMVLPYDITVQLLYYNADLLRASGVALPTDRWTFDDMLAAAQRATKKDAGQFGYDGLPNGGQFEYGVERFGGRLLNEKLTLSEMNSAGSVQGIQFWTDLRHRHNVAPANADQRAGQNMLQMFNAGRLAMAITGSGFAAQVRDAKATFDWDVLPVPRGPAGDPLRSGGGGYGLHKGVKDQEAAWQYLRHMVSNEVLMDMVGALRRSVPGRTSVAKAATIDASVAPKNWKVIIPVTEKARHITFGLTPKGGDVLTELMPVLTRVYEGSANVKAELDTLTLKINAALSR